MKLLVLDNTEEHKFVGLFEALVGDKHEIEAVDSVDLAINRVKNTVYAAVFVSNVKGRYTTVYDFISALVGSKRNRPANVLVYNDGSILAQRMRAAFGRRSVYFVDDKNLEEILGGL